MRELMKSSVKKNGARALTMAILAGGILFATAPFAWAELTPAEKSPAPVKAAQQTPAEARPALAKTAHDNPVDRADRVEARITSLHEKLHITPAQEPAWKDLAQVMRENAKAMKALLEQRSQHIKKMTAVNELRSHAEMADLHAAGLHKLITSFETLYNAMPEDQKKNADMVMAYHEKPGKHRRK